MCNIAIGVDIAKKKFDVASLSDGTLNIKFLLTMSKVSPRSLFG